MGPFETNGPESKRSGPKPDYTYRRRFPPAVKPENSSVSPCLKVGEVVTVADAKDGPGDPEFWLSKFPDCGLRSDFRMGCARLPVSSREEYGTRLDICGI